VSPKVEGSAGEWHLTVTPKSPPADFTSMTLEVDRTTLRLQGLEIADEQGGVRHFRFSGLKENQGIPDSSFAFSIPPGVEVRR
jgi:outer membrane lipoprotein-sorting protein